MTSQKDQIQALITDIDSVLQKTTPRLPWVVSGEMTQQRQVLERVRNYLVTFQRRQIAGEGFEQAGDRPDLLAHDIYSQPSQSSYQLPQVGSQAERSQPYGQNEVAAQQMLQTIVQEMGYLRSTLMQPLQSDLDRLRQQRETLVQELRQLEAQRQGYTGQLPGQQLPGQQQLIAEFLQALMSRLQETLPQQVAQSLRGANQQSLPSGTNLALSGSAPAIVTASDSSAQGFGNIQVPQSQSDELLIKLDSTLSVVFESLQRNVQAYEESLSQGLNKMHSLGQQGEMMFTALVSHLANQLGHEASSYLQPPASTKLESAQLPAPPSGAALSFAQSVQPPKTPVSPSFLEQPKADATARPLTLPFPGTELSSGIADTMPASAPNVSEPSVDTAIDSWLRSAGSVDTAPGVDLEIAALNLEGFDLNQLAAQDVNVLLELDANLLGTNLPPQPILAPEPGVDRPDQSITAEPTSDATSVEDTTDIDAALKLLEQLSSELQEQPVSLADADAQLDRMLSNPVALSDEAATGSIPDDARDELDEFYESLFGNQSSTAESPAEVAAAAEDTPVAVEKTTQPPSVPTVETELAIAPPATQPLAQPLDMQPPAVQPIDALPAETQAPTSALATPELVAPAVSAGVDPTLGWDLLAKPSVEQTAEPDIPAALLEDELLSGWDLEDTEVDLAEPEAIPAGDELFGELLSIEDAVATGDRDSSLSESPSTTPIDAATTPIDHQSSMTDANSELSVDTAFAETSTNPDEIATLTDLFGESTSDGLPLEAPIAEPPALPEIVSQPPVPTPTSVAKADSPTDDTSRQPPPAVTVDDRQADDRYTPASPEEDLLPLQATVDEPEPELWLDESTLNRLSEDLFSLEETIGDPSILPYSTEPGADIAAPFPEATAPSETAVSTGEPMSLADWNASLDDAADTVPIADSTQTSFEPEGSAIAADPPEVFLLEGMDDLFANTPITPPVTPASPPVTTQTEPSDAFTLEGMNDLFADPLTDTAPPPPTAPPANQPLPFTLEGMDDLFGDVPVVTAAPLSSAPEPTDQPPPFTLEGVDDLFADAPLADSVPAVPEADTTTLSPNLTELSLTPTEPSAFTLEQVGNLFVEVPSTSVNVSSTDSSARTVAEETIVPPSSAPSPEALPESAAAPPTPFTLEQVGDLFMEVPSGESPLEARSAEGDTAPRSPAAEPAPPFTFDQVDDLFVENPPGEALSEPLSSQPPTSTNEPSALEQAFASLLGSFDEPAFPSSETETDTQDPEKKKGMS